MRHAAIVAHLPSSDYPAFRDRRDSIIMGEPDRAVDDYTKAIELNPNDPEFRLNRGIAREAQQDYAGAMADYDAAIKLNDRFPLAYFNRANVRQQLQQYDAAVGDYERSLVLDPEQAWAYAGRGLVRLPQGRESEADADFSKALRLDPPMKADLDQRIREVRSRKQ